MPLIGFLRSRSCLYSWKAWVMLRSRASRRWVTWMATTIAAATCSPSRIGTMAWIMSPLSSSWTVVISCPPSACLTCSLLASRVGTLASTGFLTWTSSCPSRLKMVMAATPRRSCCSAR